jgi:hypothetical protein
MDTPNAHVQIQAFMNTTPRVSQSELHHWTNATAKSFDGQLQNVLTVKWLR